MKKFFSLLLVFALALTLAACRDRKNDQDLYDYDIITELPEGKIVEITVWHSFGTQLTELIQGYIDEFEKEYPNIKVTFTQEAGNYTDLRKKVVNNITTGTTPTLVFTYPDHVAAYLDGKAVLALDPFINDPKVGFTQEELDDFIDSYLEENRQFGYYMGLPFNKSTEVFIYNKTYFEDKYGKEGFENLTKLYDKIKNDQIFTWDEVAAAAKDILEDKKDDENYDKIYPFAYDSNANLFITWVRQHGLPYTNSKGEILFNTQEHADVLKKWREYNQQQLFALPIQWEEDYASTPFTQGQVFMTVGSSAGVRYNIPKDQEGNILWEIGIAPIPQVSEENKAVIQQGTNITLMANTTDEERLAAWLLIKHLTSKEVTVDWSMNSGYLPVRKSAYLSDEYQEFLKNPEEDLKYISMTARAAYLQTDYMFYDPAFSTSAAVRDQVDQAMQTIVYNTEKDVKSILEEAIAALEW